MTDFIAQNQPVGIILAKSIISKTHFDELLRRDLDLYQKLSGLGYTVKLNPETSGELSRELEEELNEAKKKIDRNQHAAEVFAKILTTALKKMAEKSKEWTEIIYHLTQIIFLWDEFIDFENYQTYGETTKIRESIFYKTATEALSEISDEDLAKLESGQTDRSIFERILTKLQLTFERKKYRSEYSFAFFEELKKNSLTTPEIIYFLLILESFLFMTVSESLMKKADRDKLDYFRNPADLNEAIAKVREIFAVDENKLEQLLEEKAENLLTEAGPDIFL